MPASIIYNENKNTKALPVIYKNKKHTITNYESDVFKINREKSHETKVFVK